MEQTQTAREEFEAALQDYKSAMQKWAQAAWDLEKPELELRTGLEEKYGFDERKKAEMHLTLERFHLAVKAAEIDASIAEKKCLFLQELLKCESTAIIHAESTEKHAQTIAEAMREEIRFLKQK